MRFFYLFLFFWRTLPLLSVATGRAFRNCAFAPAACRKLNACLPSFVRFTSKTCPAAAYGVATIPYAEAERLAAGLQVVPYAL